MNTFTVQWINRLDQFNSTTFDLIITHDQSIIPSQRIGKKYKIVDNYEEINPLFLETRAQEEIDRIVTDWNTENPV